MQRAAVSIPSNIAEGEQRYSTKDYIRFLYTSRGSLGELLTQLEITEDLYPHLKNEIMPLVAAYNNVARKLNNLITSLRNRLRIRKQEKKKKNKKNYKMDGSIVFQYYHSCCCGIQIHTCLFHTTDVYTLLSANRRRKRPQTAS